MKGLILIMSRRGYIKTDSGITLYVENDEYGRMKITAKKGRQKITEELFCLKDPSEFSYAIDLVTRIALSKLSNQGAEVPKFCVYLSVRY